MIIVSDIKEKIKSFFPMISPEEFPEVYRYLSSLQDEESVSPYETYVILENFHKLS